MKFLLFLLLFASANLALAQQDTLLPAYQRHPTIPGMQLLRTDSTRFTKEDLPKKKQLLLMLFSPDCNHCQQEAEEMSAKRDLLKNTQILMVSTSPLFRLKEFAEKYGVGQMDNVIVTKDPYYLLPSFYGIRNFPYLALYDKKGRLIRTYEGATGVEKLLQSFKAAE